jgi:hypothetical protein
MLERLLEVGEFERSEAFLGEEIGEAEGEFLCYQIRVSVIVNLSLQPVYLL